MYMWGGNLLGCHSMGVKDDVLTVFGFPVSLIRERKMRVSHPFGRMRSFHVWKALEVWVRILMRVTGIQVWPKVWVRVRMVGIWRRVRLKMRTAGIWQSEDHCRMKAWAAYIPIYQWGFILYMVGQQWSHATKERTGVKSVNMAQRILHRYGRPIWVVGSNPTSSTSRLSHKAYLLFKRYFHDLKWMCPRYFREYFLSWWLSKECFRFWASHKLHPRRCKKRVCLIRESTVSTSTTLGSDERLNRL